jgi:hypothetical protein
MSGSEPNFIMTADGEAPKNADQLRRQALRLLQQGVDERGADRQFHGVPRGAPEIAERTSEPAPARAVMIGVVTMPAVFLVVVMGALALFGKPASESKGVAAIAGVETLQQPSAAQATSPSYVAARSTVARSPAIALDEDMRIADISLDGDRVALHVESPFGQQILIYDYAKGRVVAEAAIETASIEAVDSLAMLTGAPQPAPKTVAATPAVSAVEPAAEVAAPAHPAATPRTPSIKPRGSN